ncbi:MAG: hypothetical protein LBH77_02720 [Tannerella sp.]|jgi:hypothetical protein|nr:hypothetical protein [Tannerella sp.]
MKQKVSISFIAVSVIFLLALMILPHHHHDGQACIVMEVCEQDRKVNDEHTHHTDIPDEGHAGTCIGETVFITPSFKTEAKYKTSFFKDDYLNPNYLFPVYFLVADLLNFEAGNSLFKPYGEPVSFYKSVEVAQCNGLRAPPFMLS